MQNLYSPVQIRSSPLLSRSTSPGAAVFRWLLLLLLTLLGCRLSDPPTPPAIPGPPDLPRWSTAPHVLWEGPTQVATPDGRLIALFIEAPGGPLDQLAHHADVATFLNDRFRAVFLTPTHSERARGLWFLQTSGCAVSGPLLPADPAAWIQAANAAVQAEGPGQPWPGVAGVAPGHPLSGACTGD